MGRKSRRMTMQALAAEQIAREQQLPPPPVAITPVDAPIATVTVSEKEADMRSREDALAKEAADVATQKEGLQAQLAQAALDLSAAQQARTLAQQRAETDVAQAVPDERPMPTLPSPAPPSSAGGLVPLALIAVAVYLAWRYFKKA